MYIHHDYTPARRFYAWVGFLGITVALPVYVAFAYFGAELITGLCIMAMIGLGMAFIMKLIN